MSPERRTPRPTRRSGPARRDRSGPGPGRRDDRRDTARRSVADAVAPRPEPTRRGSRLTGRAAVLVLVLAVLMVSYASSLRAYLQQRSQIAAFTTEIAERQASIDELEGRKERWKDPAYIEQQARERFGYVAPGETPYVVLDADGKPLEGDAGLSDPATVLRQEPTAWWDTAWESMALAGNPPRLGKPPAAEIDGSTEGDDSSGG